MSKEKILSSDGIPLELSLKKAERKNKLKALFLVGPLLLFILITSFISGKKLTQLDLKEAMLWAK